MERDEKLDEFVGILGRIKDLIGEAAISNEEGVDLAEAVEQLRLAEKNEDADKLAELIKRADELRAQHQAKS